VSECFGKQHWRIGSIHRSNDKKVSKIIMDTNVVSQVSDVSPWLTGTGGIAGGVGAAFLLVKGMIAKLITKIEESPSRADLDNLKATHKDHVDHCESARKETWIEINLIKEKAARHEAIVESVKEDVSYIKRRIDDIWSAVNNK